MKTILFAALFCLSLLDFARAETKPVVIGIDGEFGMLNSTSAQAIERGARVAVDEINRHGGVLGGRMLEVVTTDNKSVPARAQANLAQLAERPDLVAVLCGRFSTSILDALQMVHEKRLILLDPWAAADEITTNTLRPGYTFRLSLRDSYAMPVMMRHAKAKGVAKVAIFSMNNGWGRANVRAAEQYSAAHGSPKLIDTEWYNFGDKNFIEQYMRMRAAGAEAILMVPLEEEGAAFIHQIAALPPAMRLPLISTWGATGGKFFEKSGEDLFKVDFSVVQTFSFDRIPPARLARFMDSYRPLYGAIEPSGIMPATGIAHAYDLVQLLARAIDLAGTADRERVRQALERVRDYHGLLRDFPVPFTAERHDALSEDDVFMAIYRPDGNLVPAPAQ